MWWSRVLRTAADIRANEERKSKKFYFVNKSLLLRIVPILEYFTSPLKRMFNVFIKKDALKKHIQHGLASQIYRSCVTHCTRFLVKLEIFVFIFISMNCHSSSVACKIEQWDNGTPVRVCYIVESDKKLKDENKKHRSVS